MIVASYLDTYPHNPNFTTIFFLASREAYVC